jgi:hypothetical protein
MTFTETCWLTTAGEGAIVKVWIVGALFTLHRDGRDVIAAPVEASITVTDMS